MGQSAKMRPAGLALRGDTAWDELGVLLRLELMTNLDCIRRG